MSQVQLADVFTVEEVAQATGAPVDHLEALVAGGQLRRVPGTRFIAAAEAIRIGRVLRHTAPDLAVPRAELFAPGTSLLANRRAGVPAFASSIVHAALLVFVIVLTTMDVTTAVTEEKTNEPARLVFVVSPGPGGGGGGGALRNPLPAPKVERKAARKVNAVSVPDVTPKPVVTTRREVERPKRPTPAAAPVVAPKPPEKEPSPLPARVLVAPVVATASDTRDREGVIEKGRGEANSSGSGAGGGAGTGQGTGNGEGLGSGIGDGSGGGTGGGPYRPGSGIEPPRLLKEVKADYTDEARRRSIQGDVVLEIVVRSNGTVGDVRVLQGLGAGALQPTEQAMRQWRFDPAKRKGVPVDVIVEVAVEFTLR